VSIRSSVLVLKFRLISLCPRQQWIRDSDTRFLWAGARNFDLRMAISSVQADITYSYQTLLPTAQTLSTSAGDLSSIPLLYDRDRLIVSAGELSITRDPRLYGTGSCNYYDQSCNANGGRYECLAAPWLCRGFPDGNKGAGNVSSCMRQCLQEKHEGHMSDKNACSSGNQISPGNNAGDHASCMMGCMQNPENPYNLSGPDLPDRNPSLY
jgi:hypothetical protein